MKNKATNVQLFQHPIHASVNGQPVRILGTGEVEGNSFSYLTCDAQGQTNWLSQDSVRITDPQYLPISQEAFAAAAAQGGKTGRVDR